MIADTITNTYPHYFKILPNDDSHLFNDFRMLAVNAEAREVYLKKYTQHFRTYRNGWIHLADEDVLYVGECD